MTANTIDLHIPGYDLTGTLGAGGMADVYLAVQQNFGRPVALKIMASQRADPTFGARFMREARIVSQMRHSNIISVYDVGEVAGRYYLAMEYLEGGDLGARLARGANPALAIDVCIAIASALQYAHDKGFIHRDIKPGNVLFREDGTPVLTDFGIARAVESNTSLTEHGLMVGTPAYMSPEQALGKPLDGRSDIYSLGVLFFHALTGTVPYKSDSVISVVMQHIHEPVPRIETHQGMFQPFLDRIMAKDAAQRYQSCKDVVVDLKKLKTQWDAQNQTGISQHAAVTTKKRMSLPASTRPMMAGVAAAALLGVGVLAAKSFFVAPASLPAPAQSTQGVTDPTASKAAAELESVSDAASQSAKSALTPHAESVAAPSTSQTEKPRESAPVPAAKPAPPAWPLQAKTAVDAAKKSATDVASKSAVKTPPPAWPLQNKPAATVANKTATTNSTTTTAAATAKTPAVAPRTQAPAAPAWPLQAKPALSPQSAPPAAESKPVPPPAWPLRSN